MRAGEALRALKLRLTVLLLMLADIVVYLPCARKRIFHRADGLVFYLQLLKGVREIFVYRSRGLIEPRGKSRSVAYELCRRAAHPVGKLIQRFEQRGLIAPVLEYARLVLIQSVELRKVLRVPWAYLAYRVVEESSPHRRSVLYEVQVVRAEQHRVHRVGKLARCFLHAVYKYLFSLTGAQLYVYRLLPLMAVNVRQYIRARIPEADKLAVKACAEAPAAGEHIHRFQQICLALRVLAGYHVCPRRKLNGLKLVIAKAVERDLPDYHPLTTSKLIP